MYYNLKLTRKTTAQSNVQLCEKITFVSLQIKDKLFSAKNFLNRYIFHIHLTAKKV